MTLRRRRHPRHARPVRVGRDTGGIPFAAPGREEVNLPTLIARTAPVSAAVRARAITEEMLCHNDGRPGLLGREMRERQHCRGALPLDWTRIAGEFGERISAMAGEPR